MTRLKGFPPTVRRLIKERAGVDDPYIRCEGCGKWWVDQSIDLHHRRPRGAGGSRREDTNRAANGLSLCRAYCHPWAESNRAEATQRGWLISQHRTGITPSEVPVLLHDGWFLLDNDGGKYSVPGRAA